MTVSRRLRAAWRLVRCVWHGLHGLAIVLWVFPRLGPAQRHDRIRWWSAGMLARIGIALETSGTPWPDRSRGVLLAINHVSWLDIMVVHALLPEARFVSKADVRAWPLVSRLVDSAGTLYLEREKKRDALRVVHAMAGALRSGTAVAVFPEGTTTTGHGLLPFHANLLQAAVSTGMPVQPVALRYRDRDGPVSDAMEFVGDTTLKTSLWQTACGDGVVARLAFLPPRETAGAERRALAGALRADIAGALGLDPADAAISVRVPAPPPPRPPSPPPPDRPGTSGPPA